MNRKLVKTVSLYSNKTTARKIISVDKKNFLILCVRCHFDTEFISTKSSLKKLPVYLVVCELRSTTLTNKKVTSIVKCQNIKK